MAITTVKVPAEMAPLFEKAQEYVANYFKNRKEDPSKGTIIIGDERYILVRASSMSVQFMEFIKTLYPGLDENDANKAAGSILYDIARALGKADAAAFHKAMNVTDPIAKLSSGPVHFSYTGWAFVDILKESKPSPDENYYLIYDHPQSFEADSWLAMKKKSNSCVCHMNSGYSSGWCENSFGVELAGKEILCRAKGGPYCRFIIGHPGKGDGYIKEYKDKNPELFSLKK